MLNRYEHFALGQVFCTFPSNKTYSEIIELCMDEKALEAFNDSLEDTENEDQQLQLCERYETEWWSNVPELLDDLKEAIERNFPEAKEG